VNYPENTNRWQPGDLVIHDADAKQEEMLMQVKGYHPVTGLCITRYVHQDFLPGMRRRYLKDFRCLHNPALFGLSKTGAAATAEKSEAEP